MLYGGCIGDMDDFEGWAVDRTESDYDDIRKKCLYVVCMCVYIIPCGDTYFISALLCIKCMSYVYRKFIHCIS